MSRPGMKSSSVFRASRSAFRLSPPKASAHLNQPSPAIPGGRCSRHCTKIFLTLSDDFSARTASELCGKEDRLKVSYNLSESGHDASISLLTGKAISHRANLTASKSYYPQSDFRFDTKTFMELKNAQAVVIAYDGFNPMPPAFCYLKPYFNDANKSYFQQLEEGLL
jgi:hypothetical protein